MQELEYAVQTYDWGAIGEESLVARLKKAADPRFHIEHGTPYAELWIGTHPKAPSIVRNENFTLMPLDKWLQQSSRMLPPPSIPFLFKVLSVSKPLSIQVHPDRRTAHELHQRFPDVYTDSNHKPEMAIALTPFRALCQFRLKEDLIHYYDTVPELQELIDSKYMDAIRQNKVSDTVESYFKAFMHTTQDKVTKLLCELVDRLRDAQTKLTQADTIVLELYAHYPNDIGCFCPYILNYITLKPGQRLYIPSNQPHAYLSGDCIECMACSDNVIRAGLTPKYIDKSTLCDIVKYADSDIDVTQGSIIDDVCTSFTADMQEAQVNWLQMQPQSAYTLSVHSLPSILFFLKGNGVLQVIDGDKNMKSCTFSKGKAFLILANEKIHISCGGEKAEAYHTFPSEKLEHLQVGMGS